MDDWAQGLVLDQAPFQVLGYALGSSVDRTGPSTSPTVGDDANDSSAECFVSNTIRDDDSS